MVPTAGGWGFMITLPTPPTPAEQTPLNLDGLPADVLSEILVPLCGGQEAAVALRGVCRKLRTSLPVAAVLVPEQFSTLEDAVQAAGDCGVISIAPGIRLPDVKRRLTLTHPVAIVARGSSRCSSPPTVAFGTGLTIACTSRGRQCALLGLQLQGTDRLKPGRSLVTIKGRALVSCCRVIAGERGGVAIAVHGDNQHGDVSSSGRTGDGLDVEVRDSWITAGGGAGHPAGISVAGGSKPTRVAMYSSVLQSSDGQGTGVLAAFPAGDSSLQMHDCTIVGWEVGIDVTGAREADVERCEVQDGHDGLRCVGCTNVDVARCTIERFSHCGVIVTAATAVRVVDNDVHDCKTAAISVSTMPGGATRASPADSGGYLDSTIEPQAVSRNTIEGGGFGLIVAGGCIVDSNTIRDTAHSGVRVLTLHRCGGEVDPSPVRVLRNLISGAGQAGVLVESRGFGRVADNEIKGAALATIKIHPKSHFVVEGIADHVE